MGVQIRSTRSTGPKVSFWGRNLKLLSPMLFADVRNQSGNSLDGYVTIYINSLDPDTRDQLMESLVLMGKMPQPGSMEEHELMNKTLIDDAARKGKIVADRQAAIDRLEQYNSVRGLLPSDHNVKLLTAQLDATEWSSAGVDAAVKALTGRLEYKPAPPQPVLSNGEPQLPLGTTPTRHHSIAQLRDLDARERAARKPIAGTFSTKF
jgi:hypothetical protein